MVRSDDDGMRRHRRRLASLFVLILVATAVAATAPLHRAVLSLIARAEPLIQQHAVAGAMLFVLLSAISAVVFFFSTALITPVAVEAFGPLVTLGLLWLGWILGGLTTYAIGRLLGRSVVSWFVDPERLADYESRARRLVSFRHVLIFQLTVPSEIPGYVLGLAGCRFRTFALAMALGELPFAIGAVYLGESFLARNYAALLAIGVAGIAFSWFMVRRASRKWSSDSQRRDTGPVRGLVNDGDRRDARGDQAEVLMHAEAERGV